MVQARKLSNRGSIQYWIGTNWLQHTLFSAVFKYWPCGKNPVEGKEKESYLENKLQEEVNEYFKDKNLEELADVMEVLFGLADSLGYTEKDLIEKRNEKLKLRGGFKKGIILEEVN